MSDYIKREDAEQIMYSYGIGGTMFVDDLLKPSESEEARQKEIWEMVRNVLDRVAIKDVEPVRHGHWIEYGENKDGTHNMRCSKCGAGLKSKGHANSYYTKHKYRYCNKCGARMDAKE